MTAPSRLTTPTRGDAAAAQALGDGPVGRALARWYALFPVDATFAGLHDHDDRLPDWSPDGLARAADELRALRATLAPVEPPAPGATPHGVDRAVLDAALEVRAAELEGPHFHRGNPSLFAGEAVFSVIALVTRDFAPAAERAERLAARLGAIPRFLADAPRTIAGPIPAAWSARALRDAKGAAIFLERGVDAWLRGEPTLSPATAAAVRAAAGDAARAFAGLTAWLRERPAADQARHACGPELLDLLVRRGHWCDRGPAELLREARARLTDAEARLDAMSRYAGRGGFPEVQERLAADHPAPEAYLDAFHRIWEECRAAAVAADLVTWPEAPIRYRFIPEATREAAPHLYYLFYRSPAPFDRAPVHDYVVTPLDPSAPLDAQQAVLRANSHATIKLNHVVHHGALGHHVQNAHAYAGASLVGRVAAVDAASRITMFAGGSLAEGWACYATDLMEEVGFLTMLERVSEQHTRVRLLARAVVDLSLHTGALSMDEAAALFRDRARMPDPAARAEVAKASMFPGTAMMYWLGTQGIHDLRAARSLSGGAGSTLRRFHDTLLSYGAVPVPLIARLMREAP